MGKTAATKNNSKATAMIVAFDHAADARDYALDLRLPRLRHRGHRLSMVARRPREAVHLRRLAHDERHGAGERSELMSTENEAPAPKRKPNRKRPGKNLSLPPEKVAIWQALADKEKMKLARWIERAADAWTSSKP